MRVEEGEGEGCRVLMAVQGGVKVHLLQIHTNNISVKVLNSPLDIVFILYLSEVFYLRYLIHTKYRINLKAKYILTGGFDKKRLHSSFSLIYSC